MHLTSILYLTCLSIFSAFAQGSESSDNGSYYLEFEKIDNRVEVFLGDSLIYNSGIIRKNPKLEIQVFIDDALLEDSNELTVKLINGLDGANHGDDIHWEIKYYLFKGDEVIDWVWDDADDGRVGVVLEETYILE
ncbi:MAG: hypothetical protein ABJP45_17860 [Cyclobacteriaceae bacterium]